MATITTGDLSVQQTTESPKWSVTSNRTEIELVYNGSYANLIAGQPALGSTLAGITAAMVVDRVQITSEKGTLGQMVVSASTEGASIGGDNTVYEIDWTSLDRALEQADIFRIGGGGTYALTTADLAAIDEWKAKTTAADKSTAYTACSPNAKKFVDKLNLGQTSFLLFAPVARKTSWSFTAPSTSSAGKRQTPSGFPSLPGGYEWLQTADRGTRTGRHGKWERVQEWTGANSWDHDIYVAG